MTYKKILNIYQVLSTENNMTETDVRKIQLEESRQISSNCDNQAFSKFCKENGAKRFQDEDVNSFKELSKCL